MELRGQTALVTGATGGLGRAISRALAERGARVVASGRRAADLEALVSSLPGGGHRAEPADLAEPGAGEELVERAAPLDVLVANAGLPGAGEIEEIERDHILRALRVNLEAPMLMARAALPGMRERGHGHIVLIASLNAKAATPSTSLYAATKFGLRGFGLALREDLRGAGVGVSVVMPGFIRDAGMFADANGDDMGLGTSTPEAVGAGVVKAIERNRGELHIAPVRQTAGARIANSYPELVGRATNRLAVRAARRIAEGQRDKR
jgi:short-subunit dehydrogenase